MQQFISVKALMSDMTFKVVNNVALCTTIIAFIFNHIYNLTYLEGKEFEKGLRSLNRFA